MMEEIKNTEGIRDGVILNINSDHLQAWLKEEDKEKLKSDLKEKKYLTVKVLPGGINNDGEVVVSINGNTMLIKKIFLEKYQTFNPKP